MKNFWRSVAAEQLGYAPKAKWMVTEEAVAGREDAIRKAHINRDPIVIFNDEAVFGQNVQEASPPQIEAALLNEANINSQDMKRSEEHTSELQSLMRISYAVFCLK